MITQSCSGNKLVMAVMHASFEHHMADNALLYGALHDGWITLLCITLFMADYFTQTIFQIYVRIKDEEWNVYKRFSQFHQVHNQLKKIYPKIGKFEFPPKKNFGKKVISPLMHYRYIVYCSFVFHWQHQTKIHHK